MNELVFSFNIYNYTYCGVWHVGSDRFGFAPTHRDAVINLYHNSRNFWDYRKFLITGYNYDLLGQPIIKGPYRFRTLRKHIELVHPELLI
jgi:hypothetical protein